MRTIRHAAASLIAATAFVTAPPALAQQDVRYETVTKAEFAGAIGTLMNMAARMGGGSGETVEITSIKGNRMRTDRDRSSSIVDLDGRRFISIDHSARTYQIMTFEEMVQMMQRAGNEMRAAGQQQGRPAERNQTETEVTFRFNVDRTRERERIAGYDASRAFITIEAEGEYKPEGGDANQPAGTLVLFTDMWSSTSVPALGARQMFDTATAQAMAGAAAAFSRGLTAAIANDPKLRAGMDRAAEEARKIDGMPLRTITRTVFVPPGKQFDRAAALAPAPPSAQPSLRGALGGLMRGRGQSQQAASNQAEATQATFMTATTEVRSITTTTLDASLFEPPAGYRRVEMGG